MLDKAIKRIEQAIFKLHDDLSVLKAARGVLRNSTKQKAQDGVPLLAGKWPDRTKARKRAVPAWHTHLITAIDGEGPLTARQAAEKIDNDQAVETVRSALDAAVLRGSVCLHRGLTWKHSVHYSAGEKWLSREEMQGELDVSPRTITKYCGSGKIERRKVGRRSFYRLAIERRDKRAVDCKL